MDQDQPQSDLYFPPKTGKKLRTREVMPQIKSKFHEDFFNWLRDRGISVWEDKVLPSALHPSQKEIDLTRVAKYINDPSGSGLLTKHIIITKDNQILDGHHHWLARLKAYPDMPMPVWRIEKKLKKAFKLAWKYPMTYSSSVRPTSVKEWNDVAKMIEIDE